MNGSTMRFKPLIVEFRMGNSLMYLFAVVQGIIYMLGPAGCDFWTASTRVFLSDVAKRFMPSLTKDERRRLAD